MDISKEIFPNFVGPSFQARSKRFNDQRSVNLYPEVVEVPGKGEQIATLYSRGGLELQNTIGIGPIRGQYTLSNSQLSFIVSGPEVWQLTSVGGPPVLIGSLITSAGPVSMVDNGAHLMIVDGTYGYTVDFNSPAVVQIVDANFFPANTVTYQGGYFVLDKKGTNFFFISDLDSIDFPPLNEQFAGGSPDIVEAVISNSEQLYVIGSKTIEVWQQTGTTASAPFQRLVGRLSQIGITAPYTLARLAGTFMWLGANDQGDGIVYSMENDTPTRVSNHAIEARIQEAGDLSSSTGYGLQVDGHQFYAINLPGVDTTFVFDYTTKQWHEWTSIVAGSEGRCIGQWHCFLNGEHVIGDYRNGNIYRLNRTYYKDNGEPLRRLRQSPHMSKDLKTVFYGLMEVDMEFGVGLNDGEDYETDPKVTLQMSNDGGKTWGNPILASIGQIGEYTVRARWQMLGRSRDRVFRVWVDAPVRVAILSAYLSTQVGTA